MSELTTCNHCDLQTFRVEAKSKSQRIVMRPSNFMGGLNVWSIPHNKTLPPTQDMIEPNDQYPNGNQAYATYHIAWFGGLSEQCCC